MRKPKHFSALEVLNFSHVGLLFEFYSTKETDFIVSGLSKCTSKNIILTNETKYYPTYSNAVLIKEYEATKSRYQLSIAPQDYHSILPILESINEWISQSAETQHDTQLKMSLYFDHHQLDTLFSISTMNPTRLLLKFDENYIYERFPEQKQSPYALSIKNMAPINAYINEADVQQNINYILALPEAEYYGIDFSNYTKGILECNYVGGKDYSKKTKYIKEILEYFIIKTYQSLNEEEYAPFELHEIKRFAHNFDKIQSAYQDPEVFLNEFKDLKVFIDLKTSKQTLKTFWQNIRKPLFEMIVNGNLRKGHFNYDTELARFQLKNAEVGGTLLKNMDFVKCQITGVLENCNFISCEISKSRVYNSKFIEYNKIKESYLNGVSLNKQNDVNKCYIVNNEEVINCQITESVIKFATPGKNIKLDEQSTFIVKEMPLPKLNSAISVDEIRDFSWIRAMNQSEDKGFQNEYKKDKYKKEDLT